MYNLDPYQLKFSRNLEEFKVFGIKGYSHKQRNYKLCQKSLTVDGFEEAESVFNRNQCGGFVTAKYKGATISIDTALTIDNFAGEMYSILLRSISVAV